MFIDNTSWMYLKLKLVRYANCFFPVKNNDCMNSASLDYRKILARRGQNSYPLGWRLSAGRLFPTKPMNILSTRNLNILMMLSSEYLFLVHLSRRLKCTIVIMRLSVVRPSSLTFRFFDFSSEITERNLTKLYRKVDLNVLYQVCVFRADRKNKMAALASDWLRHF